MSEKFKPGDRILDMRAVMRSGGLFAGLVAAPVAVGLSGNGWVLCMLAAIAASVAGFAVASVIGRTVLPSPPGQTVVAKVGSASLGAALRASITGGLPISIACALLAFFDTSSISALVSLSAGLGVSVASGFLANT